MQDQGAITLITPATVEPVSLQEAKDYLAQDLDDHDELVHSLIIAARKYLENTTGIVFTTQTYELRLGYFPAVIEPRRRPLQSIESIVYIDAAGASQTLDPGDYDVDTHAFIGRVRPAFAKAWPSTRPYMNAIAVTFKAGFGDAAADVPEYLRNAVKLLIGHFYEFREEVQAGFSLHRLPLGVDALVAGERIINV